MVLDHIGLVVSDYEASKAFYTAALAPLGIVLAMEYQGNAGFGRSGRPQFWFSAGAPVHAPMHVAFVADNRAQVREFYAAALRAGAKDNGLPGLREIYHPTYYGAFVIGPDGHNIEAVCHAPEEAPQLTTNETVRVTPLLDGPVQIKGSFEMISDGGGTITCVTEAWLCRCGLSTNKPFCDGTHKKQGFKAPGTPR